MELQSLISTAQGSIVGITPWELAVVAATWARIHLDGDDEAPTIAWARRMVGSEPTTGELTEYRDNGASIREIAATCGMSRSTVARRLSQAAA